MKKVLSMILALVMLIGLLPMTALASESAEAEENLWNGRSAVFVGDSITAGSGTAEIYYHLLDQTFGFSSVTAMGVSGSCISAASDYGQSNQPLINRYQNIPSADLIVIFMGTNDYGHETPLGSVEDTEDGTFYGALNTIIPALVAKHSSSKIVFATPLHRYGFGTSNILGTQFTSDSLPNGVGATLGDYVEALKTVCANHGVSVIDLHTECTLDPADAAVRSAYMPDGLHPNAAGHKVIAEIMESHIRSYEPIEKEPIEETELVYGNRFAVGFTQQNRASSRINQYLKAGTVITLKDPDTFQWACAKTSDESSSNNLGYFPDGSWSDKETAVVAEDGWVGFVFKYRDETEAFDLTKPLSDYITIEVPHAHGYTSEVTSPTCTEQGYTTYTCTCGDSYIDNYVDALGHDYLVQVTYPTGVTKGHTDYTCSVCADSYRTPWLNETAYEGMTIACVGDSITAAVGVTKDETDYVTLLAEQLGMDYIRLGASGTTLCTDGSRTCNITRLTEGYLKGADVVTIAMGINDFCAAAEGYYELGDIDSTDSSTIYGAVRMWCERIEELRKTDGLSDTQFYFVTPVICSWNNSVTSARNWDQSKTNIHGYTLRDLCNAIIEVAALYDVAVIDLNLLSGMYYVDAQDNNTAVFGGDGVHPGAKGHEMMANAIAKAMLQNNLRDDHAHTFGSWITTTWPSCFAGEEQRVCAVCSATESRATEPDDDHHYCAMITAPTCTEQGYTTYTCTLCGHSYVDDYVEAAGHSYGEWTEVSAPTKDAMGIQQRACACGSTETQEVEGVWQLYDLADHLLQLPENVCCDTNLWALLPHEDVHFTSGKRWGTNSTPVTSITIPLNPGDRVYATSWKKAGENGHETLNGIRLTFFNTYGIAQTLGPGESYSKFAANGGYLVAPEGTIAINIAMWYDSEDYEVYILNREHTYEDVTVAPSCSEQGYSGTICLGCGDGETHSYTEALGHLLTAHEAKAPTCTGIGWESYETCSRCEHSTYTEISALGHNYGKWEQITAPTCAAEGQDKSVCANCGETVIRDTRISGDPGKILVSNPVPEGHYEEKRILAIGDSLTAGTGVTKEQRYHALLAQKLNAANISGGTSGATLCPGGHLPNKFETLMTANYLIKNDIDVVTIFLGINDWDNGVVNGTYQGKLKYDESLTYYDLGEFGTDDTTTIYGAAKMWCERILELKTTAGCEDIQFVFATPVITSWNKSVTTARDWNQDKVNVFGYTLRQYCTAIMEVCAYYEIPVLDLNMYSGMYYHSENDNNVDYFGGDGIHPGVNGHAMMADAFEEFLLEGYTYESRNVPDCGHNFDETVTVATCTEGGFTTYRCPECHYSYVDNYVDARGHSYENGACNACGLSHPNLASFEGKVISILGGSTCTFDGYIPVADGFNLTHRPRYPQSNLLTDVNDTWWMQVIAELDAKLGINDSWAGSTVSNFLDSNSGDLGPDAAMASLTRIQNLGANGTPNVILLYGAMNDIGKAVTLGTFDPAAAPTQVDLTATKWDSFADAYVAAILRMQHFYPDTEIITMLPGPTASYYTESERQAYCAVICAICEHYGVTVVDLSTCGISTSDLPDGTHPDAEGMDYITSAVLETLLSDCCMETGENVVYPVTHDLTNADASLHYYKGVSHGASFTETISGQDLTVTVTMDGLDITDSVYANGVICIENVTGPLVIAVRGTFDADGRLQQLPDNYCCDTNLWALLDPVNEYYTASGWGNSTNDVYSVTIPVTSGDWIWASSFGIAGENGFAENAVRITWFDENGVLKSLSRDKVYAEFLEYGHITVPEGAVAVNIPMATNADTWELYILNRPHIYGDWYESAGGEERRDCSTCEHYETRQVSVAVVGETKYSSLDAAIEAASTVNGTVTLLADLTVKGVVIPSGVTLNLAEHSLTADYVVGLNGGYLTAVPNAGRLIAAKGGLFLTGQGYKNASGQYILPIWDPEQNCYLFSLFVVNTNNAERGLFIDEESETIRFQFKHQATGDINKGLLGDGSSDNALKIIVRLVWESENGEAYQDFVYNDGFVKKVAVGENGVSFDYSFTLSGYSAMNIKLDTLKVVGMIITDSGAVASGTVWTDEMAK